MLVAVIGWSSMQHNQPTRLAINHHAKDLNLSYRMRRARGIAQVTVRVQGNGSSVPTRGTVLLLPICAHVKDRERNHIEKRSSRDEGLIVLNEGFMPSWWSVRQGKHEDDIDANCNNVKCESDPMETWKLGYGPYANIFYSYHHNILLQMFLHLQPCTLSKSTAIHLPLTHL